MTDRTCYIVIAASAVALIAALTGVRFCGDVTLPDRPPRPQLSGAGTVRVLAAAAGSTNAWHEQINKDAADYGIPAPSISEMSQAFVYQHEAPTLELSADRPTWVAVAGLQLRLEKASSPRGPIVALAIRNQGTSDLAYRIETRGSLGDYVCQNIVPIAHDAMVIEHGAELRRAECADRPGLVLDVLDVETLVLPTLSSFYIGHVPPEALAVEDRFAKAHQTSYGRSRPCSVSLSPSVRGALDRNLVGWRDLVDFYARHRCETYRFPLDYRAFTKDNERALPAAGAN